MLVWLNYGGYDGAHLVSHGLNCIIMVFGIYLPDIYNMYIHVPEAISCPSCLRSWECWNASGSSFCPITGIRASNDYT